MTKTSAMLASFDDYRRRMLSIIDGAHPRLPLEAPGDTDALDLGRARMSRIITAYHLFAQRELFGPCIAMAGPADRERVRATERECAELVRDFRAFTRRCAEQPVLGRWTAYRIEALGMMDRIRGHLASAETEVRWCQTAVTPMRQSRAA